MLCLNFWWSRLRTAKFFWPQKQVRNGIQPKVCIPSTKQYYYPLAPEMSCAQKILKCQNWLFNRFYVYQLFIADAETRILYLFCLSNNEKYLKIRILSFITALMAQLAQSAQKQKNYQIHLSFYSTLDV